MLGEWLIDLGQVPEAEALLVPGLAALESKLGAAHERTREARARVARMYEIAG